LLTVSDGIHNASFTFDNFNAMLYFVSDGKGGTLITDPPLSGVSGAPPNAPSGSTVVADPPPGHTLTIDSGTVLDINAASADGVTFVNGGGTNGSLVLQDSKDFAGVITGFAGDGTLANSDTIDIQDINFAKLTTETYLENAAGTGGTLTLSDGTNTASLDFAGNYVFDSFKFLSDGSGGTRVVDPPVQTASNGSLLAPTAEPTPVQHTIIDANGSVDQFVFAPTTTPAPVQHTITDSNGSVDQFVTTPAQVQHTITDLNGSADQFVFAPTSGPAQVQHTVTDFNVNLDTIDLRAFGTGVSASSLLASAAPANNGQDTLITVDSHDNMLLKNVHAASPHTSDFILHP
jgi:hypothetical protein